MSSPEFVAVMTLIALASLVYLGLHLVYGQLASDLEAESHPKLNWQRCTKASGCQTIAGSVVLDAEWRGIIRSNSTQYCYNGNAWDASVCPDGKTCAKNCGLLGVSNYYDYGVSTSGNTLTLKYQTQYRRLGSRVYLLANDSNYQTFNLLNQEFSIDVDVSRVPCVMNGAVSFLRMDADGGVARYAGNQAGAKYGTGYCSPKCPRDVKFINGEGNVFGWTPSESDSNIGYGNYGSCCEEVDVWDSNRVANSFIAHTCDSSLQTRCSGTTCGTTSDPYSGLCDPDGCDYNTYRLGNKTFYGNTGTNAVNANSKLTVVTQFITDSNLATGTLTEIRRMYIQNGKLIANSAVSVPGIDPAVNSITSQYCTNQKSVFGDTDAFAKHGGLTQIGKGLGDGMVLSFSLHSDAASHLLWLDSTYPSTKNASLPGVARGPCDSNAPIPSNDSVEQPVWTAIFSNIKLGDIGTTFNATT